MLLARASLLAYRSSHRHRPCPTPPTAEGVRKRGFVRGVESTSGTVEVSTTADTPLTVDAKSLQIVRMNALGHAVSIVSSRNARGSVDVAAVLADAGERERWVLR
jgi:hypothetical protein